MRSGGGPTRGGAPRIHGGNGIRGRGRLPRPRVGQTARWKGRPRVGVSIGRRSRRRAEQHVHDGVAEEVREDRAVPRSGSRRMVPSGRSAEKAAARPDALPRHARSARCRGGRAPGDDDMPTAPLNGIDLYYEDHGRGVPVVLMHGYGDTSQAWQPQIAALSPRYRLVTFDMR